MNFPNMHPLYARGAGPVAQADVILGLELTDFFGTVNEFIDSAEAQQASRLKQGAKLISINAVDLYMKSNFQDIQRYQPVDISIAADAEATLPSLIEAVKMEMTPARRAVADKRGQAAKAAYAQSKDRMRADAAAQAWDASPVSSARLDRRALAADQERGLGARRPQPRQLAAAHVGLQASTISIIGGSGGAGVGYNLPAAVGAALGHKQMGRLPINIQPDGDCMYAPGALWTVGASPDPAAHHHEQQPRLSSGGHAPAAHGRLASAPDGSLAHRHQDRQSECQLTPSSPIRWASPASDRSRTRPISAPALKRGIDIVKRGEPVLIDVVMQPR